MRTSIRNSFDDLFVKKWELQIFTLVLPEAVLLGCDAFRLMVPSWFSKYQISRYQVSLDDIELKTISSYVGHKKTNIELKIISIVCVKLIQLPALPEADVLIVRFPVPE